MAVDNIIRHATGMEMFRLFDSIFADIYRQVMFYEQLKGTDLPAAIEHLKNAITKPANVKARLLEYTDNYTTAELILAMTEVSDGVTAGELNTELTAMETYCANMKTAIDAETITWDQASTALQGHFENIMPRITFPFPNGYTDIWGR
jgi:hypothetical protein